MNVHFSSKTDLWSTPQNFFDEYDQEFSFSLDVCATKENAKCEKFYTAQDDGLSMPWNGNVWMNPPYGRGIGKWVEKAYIESKKGSTVVCLLPARTDTKWWHNYCMHGEIRFIKGRLKFGDSKNSAPFPSAVVIFRPPGISSQPQLPQEVEEFIALKSTAFYDENYNLVDDLLHADDLRAWMSGHVRVPVDLLEAVAHHGVDFGFGLYSIEDRHVQAARELLNASKEPS